MISNQFKYKNIVRIYNKSCYGLTELEDKSIDAIVTDPPYGISFQNNYWDKDLPDKEIWNESFRVLKPGGYMLVFSSIRLMHRLMMAIEDSGFDIKDVLFWAFLNGMPKSRDIALDIDKELGIKSKIIGHYNYVQGYKKGGADNYYAEKGKEICEPVSEIAVSRKGCGTGIKPSYEPIIMFQKPVEKGSIAKNVIEFGTGVLNLEETRIPYSPYDKKVGHNPHPMGRVISNIVRTEKFNDGYDKFFLVQKVRTHAEPYNTHPTKKPLDLVTNLVKLVSFKGQTVLDPFIGSGTTAISCMMTGRNSIGYEIDSNYFNIIKKRINCYLDEENGKLF